MSEQFTITLAQLNPTVGDVAGNAAKARRARAQARADGANLVVFPELFIAGYPPEDLVLKPAFQSACRAAIEELARETADGGPAMLIGTTTMRRIELIAVVVLVLVVELLNTAIEKLADRLTTDHDPQIGRVKDMGSAAVGVALVMAGLFWLFAIAERIGAI